MSEPAPRPTVSVLLPAYRLGEVIEANIARVLAALEGRDGVEVVACDDGSEDETADGIAAAAAASPQVIAVGHQVNRGKGAAIVTAFAASRGDVVVVLDGDMDLPPEQLPDLLATFADLEVDGLVGAKAGAMDRTTYTPLRRLLSSVFSLAIRLLFALPVHETQTGLKIFRRAPLVEILPSLETSRYTFDIELLAKMHHAGYRLAEAPVALAPGAGTTALSVRTLWEMARDTLLIRWRLRQWMRARASAPRRL
jgi:glycosyltransferase involved in cell wall biosynthesis